MAKESIQRNEKICLIVKSVDSFKIHLLRRLQDLTQDIGILEKTQVMCRELKDKNEKNPELKNVKVQFTSCSECDNCSPQLCDLQKFLSTNHQIVVLSYKSLESILLTQEKSNNSKEKLTKIKTCDNFVFVNLSNGLGLLPTLTHRIGDTLSLTEYMNKFDPQSNKNIEVAFWDRAHKLVHWLTNRINEINYYEEITEETSVIWKFKSPLTIIERCEDDSVANWEAVKNLAMAKYNVSLLSDIVTLLPAQAFAIQLKKEPTILNKEKVTIKWAIVKGLQEIRSNKSLSTSQYLSSFVLSIGGNNDNLVLGVLNQSEGDISLNIDEVKPQPITIGSKLIIFTSSIFPNQNQLDLLSLIGLPTNCIPLESYTLDEDPPYPTILCDTKKITYIDLLEGELGEKPSFKEDTIKSIEYFSEIRNKDQTEIMAGNIKSEEFLKKWQIESPDTKDLFLTHFRSKDIVPKKYLITIGFPRISRLSFVAEASNADPNTDEGIIILDDVQTKLVSTLKKWSERDTFIDTLSQVSPVYVYALGVAHLNSKTVQKDDLHYISKGYINGNTCFPEFKQKSWVKNAVITGFPTTGAKPEMFQICLELLDLNQETWDDPNDIPLLATIIFKVKKYLEKLEKKGIKTTILSDALRGNDINIEFAKNLLKRHPNVLAKYSLEFDESSERFSSNKEISDNEQQI